MSLLGSEIINLSSNGLYNKLNALFVFKIIICGIKVNDDLEKTVKSVYLYELVYYS